MTDQPTLENVEPTSPAATLTPTPGDEQLIEAALAEKLSQPLDQLAISVSSIIGEHATGSVGNGYFLAAKRGDSWLIVYDSQANSPCSDVELFQFPEDMDPECLDAGSNLVNRAGNANEPTSNLQSLDCGPGSQGANPGSAESVACSIQDGLRSRNISALLGYMADPFTIGHWLSESVQNTPQDFVILLPQLYNFNDPDYTPRLTFTTDRSQFPDMDSRPLEGR